MTMITIRTGMTIGGTSQQRISSHLSDAEKKFLAGLLHQITARPIPD
jgi:hypothetical protein